MVRAGGCTPACGAMTDAEMLAMCGQCSKIQEQILHYRGFLKQPFDPLTEQRIKEAIKELEQRKEDMHKAA
jgi:hypothetical protein